jgi:hypothetical protein
VTTFVRMSHAGVSGTPYVTQEAYYDEWQALGWTLVSGPGVGSWGISLLADRPPASTMPGTDWLVTDQNGGTLYRSNGTTWVQLAAPVALAGGGVTYDQVGAMFTDSTGYDWTYNASTHQITLAVSGGTGGLDTEAVQDAVAALIVATTSITDTYNDTTGQLSLDVSTEWLQDQVAAVFGGTHSGISMVYDDTAGTIALTVTGATVADGSITTAKLADDAVNAAKVDVTQVPVFNSEGAVTLADGASRDAGTGASHADVDETAASVVALIMNWWKARGIIVANADGTPISLQGTSGTNYVVALEGDVWRLKPQTELGGGSGGTGTLTKQSIFDPYPANARKLSAALWDAVAPPSGGTNISDSTHPTCNILIQGDSVTEAMYATWLDRLRHRIAHFNQGALPPGWYSASTATSPINAYQFALTTTGTPGTGDNAEVKRGIAGAGYQLAPGAEITLYVLQPGGGYAAGTATFDWLDVRATKVRTGGTTDIEIRVDATLVGDAISLTDGTIPTTPGYDAGRNILTWTGLLTGHTLKIKNNGSVSAVIDGVYMGDQRERVRIWNGGNSGTKYSDYLTSVNPGVLQAAKNIGFDAVLGAWGINDYGDGQTTFGNNITQYWTDVRAVLPDVTTGALIPYATQLRADWGAYVAMMKGKLAAASVPWLDLSWPIQTNAQTTDPRDLVFSDNIHQNQAFGELYAAETAKFLFGDNIDWLNAEEWIIRGRKIAAFRSVVSGIITFPAVTLWGPNTGAGASKLLSMHDSGSPSSGLIAEWGAGGRGTTDLLGLSGVNPMAAFRWRTASAFTDTSGPVDLEIWNCLTGSVTLAKRFTFLAGGMLKHETTATMPAGVASTVIEGARAVNGVMQKVAVMPDSSVQVTATPGVPRRTASLPTGYVAESFSRVEAGTANLAVLATGQLLLTQIWLEAGAIVSTLTFFTGTTVVSGLTHGHYTLYDTSLARLATTADQTTGQWGVASTPYPIALASSYTVLLSGFYYAGIDVTATTPPTLLGISGNTAIWNVAPIINGQSSTGVGATAPNPAAALTVNGFRPYVLAS